MKTETVPATPIEEHVGKSVRVWLGQFCCISGILKRDDDKYRVTVSHDSANHAFVKFAAEQASVSPNGFIRVRL